MRTAINLEAVFAILVLCGLTLRRAAQSRSEAANRKQWLLLLLVVPAALLWTMTHPAGLR